MDLFSSFSYSAPPNDQGEKSKSSPPALQKTPPLDNEKNQKPPIEQDDLLRVVKKTDQDNSYDAETEAATEAEASEVDMKTIKPISESSIQRIVAGQAVTDLASAVKELVDNAIDSRATKVFVRLYNQGLDSIEVTDNGTGVPKSSRPFMAMKHATSKLKSFEDLYNGTGLEINGNANNAGNDQDPTYAAAPTLGFRGEALFCLANLSRSLVVTTRCESTNNDGCDDGLGEQFAFNHDGLLIAESVKPIPRSVGTTVTVNGLFETLPVRRVDMQKRIKAQRMKLMKMMQGYAILCTNIQFMLTDIQTANSQPNKSKSKSDVRLATSESSNTLEKRTASVLGTKFLAGLTRIEVDLTSLVGPVNAQSSQQSSTLLTRSCRWKVEGLVSHAPTSPKPASARDLQFFSINGRPVDLPTISRVLGDIWRSYYPATAAGGNGGGARRRPACILAFTLPNNMYDVNLSPDKREVMFTDEIAITELIRENLVTIWADQSEGHFAANVVESRSNLMTRSHSHESERNSEEITQSQTDPGKPDHENVTPRLRRSKASVDKVSFGEKITGSGNPAAITPQEEICIADEDTVTSKTKATMSVGSHSGSASMPQVSILNHSHSGEETHSDKIPNQPDKTASIHRIKPKYSDIKRWDQMRLNFRRVEKSQLQDEIHQVLSSDYDANDEMYDSPVTKNQSDRRLTSTNGRTESNKRANFKATTEYTSMKRSKRTERDKGSSLNEFAFQPSVSSKARVEENNQSDEEESANDNNDESVLIRENDSDERSHDEIQMIKERNRRMVIGKRVEVVRRSRNGEKDDSSQSIEPPSRDDARHSEMHESLPSKQSTEEVIWNAFSGTKRVITDYQNSRNAMRKHRHYLRSSLKKEKDASLNENNGDESANYDMDATVHLTKDDFKDMSIIGQFNLGFILARCRNQNLWILDQHACDEIYNFERLCKETVIHEQKLIAPLPLELSPSEENCVLENLDIFERNGFRFVYNPEKEIRHRLSLTALPHSGSGRDGKKPVQFGKEDVGALCAMLGADGTSSSDGFNAGFGSGADGSGLYGNNAVRRYAEVSGSSQSVERHSKGVSGSNIVRLPKAIAMFASRACRGSIMIGDALSRKEQNAVVEKLHKVEIPWNCPHGRPTMSHVRSLAEWLLDDDEEMAAYVAGPSLSVFSQE